MPPGRARRAVRRTFSSLRVRNYRLFFIGQTVSNTGNWLTMVALTLLILHRTGSGFAVGLLTACQFGPILVLGVWAGSIADRVDKRRLLFLTQGLEMAQSVALAALAFHPDPPVGALFAVAAVGGTVLAFDNPLRRSFVAEMVPPDEVPNAVALYSAIVNTSRVFGPALAGALVVSVGYGWAFTVDAASYLVVLAALAMMRPAELRRTPSRPRRRGDIRAAFRYLARTPDLRITFILLTVVGTFGYNFSVVLPLFVEHGMHEGDAVYTAVYATFSAGALLAALVVAGRRLVYLRHVLRAAGLFGVASLVLAATPSLPAVFPVVFLVGLAGVTYMTSTTAIVQVTGEPGMHGRLLALQTVLLVGTTPIGGPLLGWLSDTAGARAPLVLGGVATLAGTAWAVVAHRRAGEHGAVAAAGADAPTELVH